MGLTAALLGTQETPVGDSVYGTPRTFQATVANLGTQTDIQGNLTFFAGATPICTAPFLPNNTLVGTTVSLLASHVAVMHFDDTTVSLSCTLFQYMPGKPFVKHLLPNIMDGG